MTKAMNMGKRAVACDGKRYYFRRKASNDAMAERIAMHVERGWLTYSHTVDDVEVFDVSPKAPFRVRQIKPHEAAFNQLLDDITECACNEQWRDYYLAVRELAWWIKNAGQPKEAFQNLVQHCLNSAVNITGNGLLPDRARVEVNALQRKEQPIIMVGPKPTRQ